MSTNDGVAYTFVYYPKGQNRCKNERIRGSPHVFIDNKWCYAQKLPIREYLIEIAMCVYVQNSIIFKR